MFAEGIARALGPDFQAIEDSEKRVSHVIVHGPTKTELVPIRGGTFVMGFSADDLHAVWGAVESFSDIRSYVQRSRPAHVVTVKPFLMAHSLAVEEGDEVAPRKVIAMAKAHGFRLPTEAEWEWMAREGGRVRFTGVPMDNHPLSPASAEGSHHEGPNGFGIQNLHSSELVMDALHDTYDGAPVDGSAWGEGAGVARWGHIWWQDANEVLSLHAAIRNVPEDDARFRFALDIPGAASPKREKIDWQVTMKETLAGFTAKDPLPSIRTLETLLSIAIHDDTRALLAALPPILKKMTTARDEITRVLYDASKNKAVRELIAKYGLSIKEPSPKSPTIAVKIGLPQSAMAGRTPDRRNLATDVRGPKGKERWAVKFSREITGPVIAADGTIFVGVRDGRLCAVSPKDGTTIWSYRGKGEVISTPALGPEGSVWFATTKGMIYGLPINGDERHMVAIALKSPVTADLAIYDHALIVLPVNGELTAIERGAIKWRVPCEGEVDVRGAPAIGADGTIYVQRADERIHVHSSTNGELRATSKERYIVRATPLVGRNGSLYVVDDQGVGALGPRGNQLWYQKFTSIDEDLWGSMGGLSQDQDGNLYLSSMAIGRVRARAFGRRRQADSKAPSEQLGSRTGHDRRRQKRLFRLVDKRLRVRREGQTTLDRENQGALDGSNGVSQGRDALCVDRQRLFVRVRQLDEAVPAMSARAW